MDQLGDMSGGKQDFRYSELTSTQQAALEPYEDVIEKWQDGTTLTDSDYEIIDQLLEDF